MAKQLDGDSNTQETEGTQIRINKTVQKIREGLEERQVLITTECEKAAKVVLENCKDNPKHVADLLNFLTRFEESIKSTKGEEKSLTRGIVVCFPLKEPDKNMQFESTEGKSKIIKENEEAKATVKVSVEVTGRTFGADKVLLGKLKSLTETKDQQQCDVIILFCPITSRVGSDVEAAMTKPRADKPVILVLMHHTLNPDLTTGNVMWSEKYRKIEKHVHVLYHRSEGGLLKNSEVNDRAVKQLQEQLSKHSH